MLLTSSESFGILVVDDAQSTLDAIRLILKDTHEIHTARSGEEALELVLKHNFDLIFLDITLSGALDGLEVLKRVRDTGGSETIVMLTASHDLQTAVKAMQLGAFDYITKPFEPSQILAVLQKSDKNRQLVREVNYLRSEVKPTHFDSIVGKSRSIMGVVRMIEKVADTDATVLITGPTGTGKELVARALHFNGLRQKEPFVAINCAGIPENLLETELFGYERGAFTGAERQKLGKFELADKGTVFLDEVSCLRGDMQGKILRVLQEQTLERVGGTRTVRLNVRIIAATNGDLRKAIAQDKFRPDLYYRLNVVPIVLPVLKDRREDIPLLLSHFLDIYSRRLGKNIQGISKEMLRYLVGYDWPGNVRELQNVVERLVVLAETSELEMKHLPIDVFLQPEGKDKIPCSEGLPLKEARDSFERDYIGAVLRRSAWNKTRAAHLLGIHRNTLILKLDELGIKKSDPLS